MKITQYKHPKIDYKKLITRKAYKKSVINKLKFWYFYNKYSEETAFYWLYKDIKKRNQIHTYIKFFNIESNIFKNNASTCEYFYKKLYSKVCPECNKTFVPTKKDGIFCSNKCSNSHKAKNPDYIKKLSKAVKQSWKNLSKEDKEERCKLISEGNKKFYSNLSDEEYKEFWRNWNNTYSKNCMNKYNYNNYFGVPEHIEILKEKRKVTNIIRYGGPVPWCREDTKPPQLQRSHVSPPF